MKRWQRWLIALPSLMLFVAATQWAMRGRHEPTGNVGYLGTENAGVEGTNADGSVYGRLADGPAGVRGQGYFGVIGFSTFSSAGSSNAAGVYGEGNFAGVHGHTPSTEPNGVGVYGDGATGVHGFSVGGFGVEGRTHSGTGVYGSLETGGTGHAGWFEGRMHVNGLLTKSAGSFKIDHPLDPAHKYLSHSFVESPDMKNIYDGVAKLGDDGTAVVELPEWFDALNKDFRYQLTCIGEHAPVYVAEKIKDNHFRIAGGYAEMEVSWQVTGTRRDPYAEMNRIVVEEAKAPHEIGKFLHPELYSQSATQRIDPAQRLVR